MIEINKKKTENFLYNDWLEWLRQFSAAEMRESEDALSRELPAEGYAALARWLEIFDNPSKMDKLSQGRIKAQQEASIMEVAVGDDDEAFYMDLIRKNVSELEGASPQEVARLSQNINIYRQQLQDIRSHRPKSGSVLAEVLALAQKPKTTAKKSSSSTKTAKKPKKTTAKRSSAKKSTSKIASKSKKSKKNGLTTSGENNG